MTNYAVMYFWQVVLAAYFAPTYVALSRHDRNAVSVGIANALAGWTVVGWIAILAYVCRGNPRASRQRV